MKLFCSLKAMFLLMACLVISPLSALGVTVDISVPGTLEKTLEDVDDASFPTLKIIGQLNGADIKYLRTQAGRLTSIEVLDLSDATLVEGGGEYAIIQYNDYDVVMDKYTCTYYYSSEYKKEVVKQSNMLGGRDFKVTTYSDDCAGMFYGMNYKEVKLPKNVKTIGERAFYGCKNLQTATATLPIESIDEKAFMNCKALETFQTETAKHIGKEAFYKCDKFIGNVDSTLILTATDTIHAYSFTATSIKNVKPSANLKYIGDNAFGECKELENIDLPSQLQEIGNSAFRNCTSITSIILPSSMQRIGEEAFYGCTLLKDVEILSAPYGLSADIFKGTPYEKTLKADDDGIVYINNVAIREICKQSTNHTIKFKEGTISIAPHFASYTRTREGGLYAANDYVTSIELPSTIRRIDDNAFSSYFKNLESILINEGVEEIGDNAFSGLKIAEIKLPESLRKIGTKSFWACSNLKKIKLPSGIESIGKEAFAKCTSLTGEITIPESMVSLGDNAFYDSNLYRIVFNAKNVDGGSHLCTNTERLLIGTNVEVLPNTMFAYGKLKKITFEERNDNAQLRIGTFCFEECDNLESISFPKGYIEVKDNAFFGCSNLAEINVAGIVKTIGNNAFSGTKITNISFPDGLKTIGNEAFAYCDNLKSVNLGKTIKYIGEAAFIPSYNQECCLTDIYLGECLDSIGKGAFSGCKAIQHIFLPQTIKKIGDGAFRDCYGLSAIEFPTNLEYIGSSAFFRCPLRSITIPARVKIIGAQAFYGTELDIVTLPEGVEEIGKEAFRTVNPMSLLSVPSTVKTFGSYFTNAKCIELNMTEPQELPNVTFPSASTIGTTLRVPAGLLQVYKKVYPWSEFKQIVEMAPDEKDYSLNMPAKDISKGTSLSLPISMVNVETIAGIQFELTLPQGIELAKDKNNEYIANKTERTEAQSVMINKDNAKDNTYIVVIMSFDGSHIKGNEGELLSLPLFANNNVEEGENTISLKSIVLTTESGKTLYPKDANATLTVNTTSYTMGDVNGDSNINVTDVVSIVNHILKRDNVKFIEEAADMNGDGIINVTDALSIVNIILKTNK